MRRIGTFSTVRASPLIVKRGGKMEAASENGGEPIAKRHGFTRSALLSSQNLSGRPYSRRGRPVGVGSADRVPPPFTAA